MHTQTKLVAFALIFFTFSGVCFGNLFEDMFGMGARTKAMGGAGIATVKDVSAIYNNPSGLVACTGTQITLGYQHTGTHFGSSINDVSTQPDQIGNEPRVELGLCLPLPLRFAFGLSIAGNPVDPVAIELSTINSAPRMLMFGPMLRLPSLMMGLGYHIVPKLAVGVGFSVGAVGEATHSVAASLDASAPIAVNANVHLVPHTALYAGVQYFPISSVAVGLIYRSAARSLFAARGNVSIKFGGANPLEIGQILESLIAYSPEQIGMGVSYSPMSNLTFAVDGTWYHWNTYTGPFLQIGAGDNSPLSNPPIYPPVEETHFRNTVAPRFGAEYVWDNFLAFRAGYAFRPSPIPASNGRATLLDSDTHTATFGTGVTFSVAKDLKLAVDGFASIHAMTPRTVIKSDPNGTEQTIHFGGLAYNTGLAITATY